MNLICIIDQQEHTDDFFRGKLSFLCVGIVRSSGLGNSLMVTLSLGWGQPGPFFGLYIMLFCEKKQITNTIE